VGKEKIRGNPFIVGERPAAYPRARSSRIEEDVVALGVGEVWQIVVHQVGSIIDEKKSAGSEEAQAHGASRLRDIKVEDNLGIGALDFFYDANHLQRKLKGIRIRALFFAIGGSSVPVIR